MEEFYRKLNDGSIASQEPDGREIVSSMRRAKITGPTVIEWCETCFCSPPLAHERETIYDHYLTDMVVIPTDADPDIHGDSFWEYLTQQS